MLTSNQNNLVWIDHGGIAHPMGVFASQQMRTRQGAFCLLPTPDHVIFMRYHDVHEPSERTKNFNVRLAGEITTAGTMCDIMAFIAQNGWSGELNVQSAVSNRSIYLEEGRVIGAKTNVEEEHLGQLLQREGVLHKQQIEQIRQRMDKERIQFGVATVQLGFLTEEQIYTYLARQIKEIVISILMVSEGMFCFLDSFDREALSFRHSLNLNQLLMEGATQMDEMRYFRQRIPSSEYIPKQLSQSDEFSEEMRQIYLQIDGKASIVDIVRQTGMSEFQATKKIFQLLQLNAVQILPPMAKTDPQQIIEIANRILLQIHQASDLVDRGKALRSNLSRFTDKAYQIMFHEAGPAIDGTFLPAILLHNSQELVSGGSLEAFLRDMLYDYVSFALFSAESMLGNTNERILRKEVEPLLNQLHPLD